MALFCHSPPLSPQEPCHWTFYSADVCIKPAEQNTSVRLKFMWPIPSHSQRFYANEMLTHWCIFHFAPKAVHICKTNLFKFTKKEQWIQNSKYSRLEKTSQCCQRVQNMSQRGIHLVPQKEWICDIIGWVTWKEYTNQGLSGCEWDGVLALWTRSLQAKKKVRLCWNSAMFSFKWLFDFPMVPSFPLSNKERQFNRQGKLQDFQNPGCTSG